MSDRRLKADLIVLDFSMEMGVSTEQFKRNDKSKALSAARRQCWVRLAEELGLGDGYIGYMFNRSRQAIFLGRKYNKNANAV